MQRLALLGTRWLAEEMFDLISEMPDFEVDLFVENMDRERCEHPLEGRPVIWVDELAELADSHLAICAISTTHRHRYVEQVEALGVRFATLTHPTARVSTRAVLGEGCFVGPESIISTRTTLGRHVFLNRGVLVGHHSTIGDYVTIQPGANVAGLVTVGERTFIGMGAVVLDRINIGKGCVIAAGAVVTKDVPDYTQVMGVPARVSKTDIDPR